MSFPISISFNKKLGITIDSDNREQILQYIKEDILQDKADNVVAEDMSVKYQGSTSVWRGSLYKTVDKGVFSLLYTDNVWRLKYQINMRSLFLDTTVISAVIGVLLFIVDGPSWVGIAAFSWLCGGNWVINIVRHENVATNIAYGIDNMMNPEEELPEIEKIPGKLKSWF